jgi:hypothetical protein
MAPPAEALFSYQSTVKQLSFEEYFFAAFGADFSYQLSSQQLSVEENSFAACGAFGFLIWLPEAYALRLTIFRPFGTDGIF